MVVKVRTLQTEFNTKLGIPIPKEKKEFFINDIEHARRETIMSLNKSRRRVVMTKGNLIKKKVIKRKNPQAEENFQFRVASGIKVIDMLFPDQNNPDDKTYKFKKFQEIFDIIFPVNRQTDTTRKLVRNILSQLKKAVSEKVLTLNRIWQISEAFRKDPRPDHEKRIELLELWHINYGKLWSDKRNKIKSPKPITTTKPKEKKEEVKPILSSEKLQKTIAIPNDEGPIEFSLEFGGISILIEKDKKTSITIKIG